MKKPNIVLQHIIPKQALTRLAGLLANKQCGTLTTKVIAWFVKRYKVNMDEAANADIASYKSFNDFFTRPLKQDARPLAKAEFICPVDGAISQFGSIEKDQIFQAKGHSYSALALVGGNSTLAEQFEKRSFCVLVFKPKRLPPHSHAVRWRFKNHDLRAR